MCITQSSSARIVVNLIDTLKVGVQMTRNSWKQLSYRYHYHMTHLMTQTTHSTTHLTHLYAINDAFDAINDVFDTFNNAFDVFNDVFYAFNDAFNAFWRILDVLMFLKQLTTHLTQWHIWRIQRRMRRRIWRIQRILTWLIQRHIWRILT